MKKSIIYLLLVAMIPMACTKQLPLLGSAKNASTTPATGQTLKTAYLIKKGNHYSEESRVELISKPSIYASIVFDSSAMYQSVTAENQWDVNKLIGFSDGGTDHQENSARLGWSWNGEALVIYAYAYNDKQRITKTLGTAPLNKPFNCSVTAVKGQYYFTLNDGVDSIPRHCSDYVGTHYKLFPYFGGDEVAPHDIRLSIEETNP